MTIYRPQIHTLPKGGRRTSWFRNSGRSPFSTETLPAPTALVNNTSMSFDGVDEYATLGRVTTMDGENALTVAFWIYSSPISVNDWAMGQWRTSHRVWAIFTRGTLGLRFMLSNNGTTQNFVETTAGTFTAGQWHHVVCVYGSSTATVYVDGVAVSTNLTGTIPAAVHSSTLGDTFIGGVDNGPTAPLAGSLDEVAWWPGVAATAGQVAEIYNGAIPVDLMDLATMPNPSYWFRGELSVFPTLANNGSAGTTATMTNQEAGDLDTSLFAP